MLSKNPFKTAGGTICINYILLFPYSTKYFCLNFPFARPVKWRYICSTFDGLANEFPKRVKKCEALASKYAVGPHYYLESLGV